MDSHLSEETVQRWRARELSPSELIAADAHLADCPECADRLSGGLPALGSLLTAPVAEAFHLGYSLIQGVVEGTLDPIDREIAEAHLGTCGPCATELAELRAFRAEMSTQPARQHRPLGSPAPAGPNPTPRISQRSEPAQAPPLGWLRWIWSFGAAAALVAVVVFGLMPMRSELAALRARTGDLTYQLSLGERTRRERDRLQTELDLARLQATRLRDENNRLQSGVRPGGEPSPTGPEPGPRIAASPTRITEGVPLSVLGLTGKADRLMGGGGEGVPFRLLGPVGTGVATLRPALRWQGVAGAEKYRVTLAHPNGDVVRSPDLISPEWTVTRPLQAGAAYSWQVTAYRGGEEIVSPAPPAPEARFRVLDKAALQALRVQTGRSHMELGFVYARAGLLDDAERELLLALDANPSLEPVRRQLAAVRRWRGGPR